MLAELCWRDAGDFAKRSREGADHGLRELDHEFGDGPAARCSDSGAHAHRPEWRQHQRCGLLGFDVEDAEYVRAATAMTQREWDEIRSAAQLGCAVAGLGEGQPDFRAGIVVSIKDGVVTTIYLTCGDTTLFTITLRRNNEIWIPNGSGMNRACY